MEQEDYLKRQIDQLARVLGKVLFDLMGLKNTPKLNDGIEITNQTLKSELDFNIDELSEFPNETFIKQIQSNKKLSNESLNNLAEILLFIADSNPTKQKKLYQKCLLIFEYLEKNDTLYSMDRQWKIERLKLK